MTFEHKGFNIVISAAGKFEVDSRPDITATDSLTQMKAKIDTMLKAERKPLNAIMFSGDGWDRLAAVSIVGVTVTSTARSQYGSGYAWTRNARGGRSKEDGRDVYLDTKENRKTMTEINGLTKEARAIDTKIEGLRKLLKTVPIEGGPE